MFVFAIPCARLKGLEEEEGGGRGGGGGAEMERVRCVGGRKRARKSPWGSPGAVMGVVEGEQRAWRMKDGA